VHPFRDRPRRYSCHRLSESVQLSTSSFRPVSLAVVCVCQSSHNCLLCRRHLVTLSAFLVKPPLSVRVKLTSFLRRVPCITLFCNRLTQVCQFSSELSVCQFSLSCHVLSYPVALSVPVKLTPNPLLIRPVSLSVITRALSVQVKLTPSAVSTLHVIVFPIITRPMSTFSENMPLRLCSRSDPVTHLNPFLRRTRPISGYPRIRRTRLFRLIMRMISRRCTTMH
jgi:hypothetical protein